MYGKRIWTLRLVGVGVFIFLTGTRLHSAKRRAESTQQDEQLWNKVGPVAIVRSVGAIGRNVRSTALQTHE